MGKQTVTDWSRTSEVMDVLDEAKVRISVLRHFQPSHATELSRHFRKKAKPDKWDEDTKQEIVECVKRCESERYTSRSSRRATVSDLEAHQSDAYDKLPAKQKKAVHDGDKTLVQVRREQKDKKRAAACDRRSYTSHRHFL